MSVTAAPSRPATPFFKLIVHASTPLVKGLLRLRASGLEHVPPEGGFIVASNHLSNFDPWAVGYPLYPRQIHFMAKSELYANPVLRWILTRGGTFPVHRGRHDSEAFKTAVRLAREGGVVAMFPEGTRRSKGLRKKHSAAPHTGAARIALAAGVPILPAAVVGTDRVARLAEVRVAYGPAISMDGQGGPRRVAAREGTERLMAEIARLERELGT